MKGSLLVVLMGVVAFEGCKPRAFAPRTSTEAPPAAAAAGPAEAPARRPARPPCPESAARVFFHAYTLSIPFRNGRVATQISAATPLAQFAVEERARLGRDAPAIRCGRAVAYAFMLNGAQQGRESGQMADRIAEKWAGSVPPDII